MEMGQPSEALKGSSERFPRLSKSATTGGGRGGVTVERCRLPASTEEREGSSCIGGGRSKSWRVWSDL